ncbi:MAG: Rrf2 family transcriptional regulator [Actinobacteria bacterium]|nr:Rrf2 family transcriptional regulator [Actinomycetota bacterium]
MWISRRTDYATRAVLALSLAGGTQPMKLQELADRTAVPLSVLEQIMPVLRTAGVARSERGRSGGYRLNHPPGKITLETVVRLFEGQLAPIACATRKEPESCSMMCGCSLRSAWEEIRDNTIDLLGRTTFADLAAGAAGPWLDSDQIEPVD